MVPGIYAFEMIVLFNRGQILDALQASASCGFVIGALAMGLATVRVSAHNSPVNQGHDRTAQQTMGPRSDALQARHNANISPIVDHDLFTPASIYIGARLWF
jgi:hypothetical protein